MARSLARMARWLADLADPGKTIEQSWIQHPTLLDVNVEIVAKRYPTLL